MNIKNFYFTYGTEGHPFYGGWSKIEAPTREIAIALFRLIHPDKTPGLVNCSSIYDEETFRKTSMWIRGNFGIHEHEVVSMQHIRVSEHAAAFLAGRDSK